MEPGKLTPRSKIYAVRSYWFRSEKQPRNFEVKGIETQEQKADIVTKGLRKDIFLTIQKLLCGF